MAPSFGGPALAFSRDSVLRNPTTTFGECRSPRVLFEGTCDVALACSKQQASALTTRKPLRRPIHPVMNDDSQRLSRTEVVFTCQACKGISQMQCSSTLAPARSRSSRLPYIVGKCIARAFVGEVRPQSGDAQRLCQNDRDCTGDRSLGRFLRQKIRRSPTSDSSMRAVLAGRQGVPAGQQIAMKPGLQTLPVRSRGCYC